MVKGNTKMNYEKLSRAIRYYYKCKIFAIVEGKRLVYKFGSRATGWKPRPGQDSSSAGERDSIWCTSSGPAPRAGSLARVRTHPRLVSGTPSGVQVRVPRHGLEASPGSGLILGW